MQNLLNDLRAELLSQRNWDSKVPFIILITCVQGFQVEPDGNSDMVTLMICMRENVVNPPLYVGTCLVYTALLGRFFVKITQA